MNGNPALEHLQVIRTLMERSALYQRALAPIALAAGVIGVVAGALGPALGMSSRNEFVTYWLAIGAATIAVAFVLARRQAFRDAEHFWSPPTRRVTLALAPAFGVGLAAGLLTVMSSGADFLPVAGLPLLWLVLYGCGLHAAGFFMPRGVQRLGWLFISAGLILAGWCVAAGGPGVAWNGHHVMGIAFGGGHLVFAAWLFAIRPRNPAP
jgi:hypothetical protein